MPNHPVDVTTVGFSIASALYFVATGLFFAHLLRGGIRPAQLATRAMTAAAVAHAGYLASQLISHGRGPFGSIDDTLALGSLLVTAAYLGTMRRHRLTVLGAFIAPITLVMLLGAGLNSHVAQVPSEIKSALLPLHITVNILGITAFALAFAVAIAYMIQEHRLRQRELSGIFQRLPALDVLDSMGLRLVTIGFPLFTVGILTGTAWAVGGEQGTASVSLGQGFALLSWVFFGTVLLARAAAGWRGRRAAVGTVLGFLCAMAALLGYAVRGLGAS